MPPRSTQLPASAVEMDRHTGAVTLKFGGKDYVLPPPDLGQLREITTLLVGCEEDERAEEEARMARPDDAPEDWEPPPLSEMAALDRVVVRAGVVRKIAEILGTPLPESVPPWLGAGQLPTLLNGHWLLHPFLALGSPETEESG